MVSQETLHSKAFFLSSFHFRLCALSHLLEDLLHPSQKLTPFCVLLPQLPTAYASLQMSQLAAA